MKHMKFLTFFFCIAFAVFACSSNNETDPNAGGIPDKEEPLALHIEHTIQEDALQTISMLHQNSN